MPEVTIDKPAQPQASPQTTESLTATLVNQTQANLLLVKSASGLQWTRPPPATITPGQSGQFASPGDFSNPSSGSVVYQSASSGGATFTLTWDIPSVGANSIHWQTTPGLTAQESGSLSGWNLSASWFISG
ncbi:hypothetical protein MYSTI_08097 [Myxococcus stipitatus DSM 14675]|uniref:Uncharacterized protein n=1 Tax=Myxococcus stipitatus (strain DSM 14675 / JCM 12634 / Mx s8) TaxID=1278073 RepID=L7UMY8_MYXSD|nr:hypothetical protein [Myxococcus stipitatus]AGC49363.1 hypothetical protein MYSTI_08097 [Myxococcus stipitatus DSM 14675]